MAPANSMIAAMMIACFTVTAPEPTEVPMALATSLAPMPQVMYRPNMIASARKMVLFCAMISMINPPKSYGSPTQRERRVTDSPINAIVLGGPDQRASNRRTRSPTFSADSAESRIHRMR